MKRWIIGFAFLFCAVRPASAQTPLPETQAVKATVCDLENHPQTYDRKLVQVRGRIYFGKFDFVVDSDCKPHRQARIWLDFGGDIVSPSVYWGIGNVLPKKKGVDVRVEGVAVPAVRDAAMDRFVEEVGATRLRKPNGDPCGPECQIYRVSATLTGMFFSGIPHGFGTEECCHLLVIEQVTALASKRTGVPVGGEYECSSDRWEPNAEELKKLSAIPACSLGDSFQKCYPFLAKHWGDSITQADALADDHGWVSRDMTRYYKFSGNFTGHVVGKDARGNPLYMSEIAPSSFVTRETCRATVPPKPASERASCRFYESGPLESGDAVLASQKQVDSGGDAWRTSDVARVGWMAAEDAAKQWRLLTSPQIKLEKCEPWPPTKDPGADQQQWGYCTWVSKDDMEEITVRLHRASDSKSARNKIENIAWIASDVEINACKTEP